MKTLSLPNDQLIPHIRRAIQEGHTATFRVRGFSMRIFLEDSRDKVVLSPTGGSVKKGDVVLAEITKGVYVLHRVIRISGNRITLQGDGNVAGTEQCTTADIIGVVTGFIRKGRNHIDPASGWKWRTYSAIWLSLTPVRRLLLALHRRIWLKIFPVNTHLQNNNNK